MMRILLNPHDWLGQHPYVCMAIGFAGYLLASSL